MRQMVKAAVLYKANQPMAISELKQKEPRSGEVKLKVVAAGICASDHHIMTGTANFPLPMVLGHEGAGVVEEVGPNVTKVKPGDRCALSFVSFCGYCEACRKGTTYMCDTHRATGGRLLDDSARLEDDQGQAVFQFGKLGVFSEVAVVPQEACFVVPDGIPLEEVAIVGCAVSTGAGAVISRGVAPGDAVAVIGVGGVGLAAIMAAKALNAAPIVAVDIHDHKLEFAREFGATHTVNSLKTDAGQAVTKICGGGVSRSFDTFGSTSTTELAVKLLAKSGTATVVGLAPEGSYAKVDIVDMARNEKRLEGCYYGSTHPFAAFARIFKLMEHGVFDVGKLIARRYGLDQINEAYDDLAAGKNGRGVLVYR